MGVFIQLLKKKQIDVNGHPTTFEAGDWAEVGVGYARRLVADNEATVPGDKFKLLLPARAGILCHEGQRKQAEVAAAVYGKAIQTQEGAWLDLPYAKCLLWDMSAPFRLEFLPVGFNLLARWHLAIPLVSYDLLAAACGTETDRAATAAIIHDLRVPVYDPRLLFVRRCPETKEFLTTWAAERAAGGCPELALLRALYRCKPLLLALPPSWRTA